MLSIDKERGRNMNRRQMEVKPGGKKKKLNVIHKEGPREFFPTCDKCRL